MAKIDPTELEALKQEKIKTLTEFLAAQPPDQNGEFLLNLWQKLYSEDIKGASVTTVNGPSDDEENLVFPYEKIQAVVGDGNNWKWPRMWQRFDEITRRGEAYRPNEALNFRQPNKNPNIVAQRVLVVGGGPVGIRMAIELVMGGHIVTVVEQRRELKNEDGTLEKLGFTNRINRPHMWPFVRNDLAKLNGKDLMSRAAAYPVFTEPETSSIGIDELQLLLLKSALLLGVDFRLGVKYTNAVIKNEGDSMMPFWDCELTADAQAQEAYKMEATSRFEVDCLIGCDGPRSAVRDTQGKYFGTVEKRKFMDCVGIVSNVQKVPRKRLKEMGFENGQEPTDMNRTRMVFKDFFGKIQKEADADIENLIYYKASHHNYTILVPKRADLIKHGLSGKVMGFHAGRDAHSKMNEEKAKLKAYCTRVLKAAGIPLDEKAANGGFVGEPNDCMAFDFSECWNTKKSTAFELPPPGYSVETEGPWTGKKLIPFVCLAGDALLEPFWPMGLGLKRGWQAVMDTNFAIDNLFNRTFFCARKKQDPEQWQWEEHYEALREMCVANFEYCNRLQITPEFSKGEYEDKGAVMTQLKKVYKDSEKPPFEVEIDPWTRYEPLVLEIKNDWKMSEELLPVVSRAVAVREFYDEHSKGGKNGEIEYQGKELISINGQIVGGYAQHGKRPSVTEKKVEKVEPSKPQGIGALMGGGAKPKPPGGMGGGIGGLIAQQGKPSAQGSMAALMMGGKKKDPEAEEATEEPAAAAAGGRNSVKRGSIPVAEFLPKRALELLNSSTPPATKAKALIQVQEAIQGLKEDLRLLEQAEKDLKQVVGK